MRNHKVVTFICNWSALGGLETAGRDHLTYPAAVRPIKVMCLGRLRTGHILKALEKGAAGVMLIGCGPDDCYYETGYRCAEEVYTETKALLYVLGYHETQLKLNWITAGDGAGFVKTVTDFVTGLKGDMAS